MRRNEIIARANVIKARLRLVPYIVDLESEGMTRLMAARLLAAELLDIIEDRGNYRLLLAATHALAEDTESAIADCDVNDEVSRVFGGIADECGVDYADLVKPPKRQKRARATA